MNMPFEVLAKRSLQLNRHRLVSASSGTSFPNRQCLSTCRHVSNGCYISGRLADSRGRNFTLIYNTTTTYPRSQRLALSRWRLQSERRFSLSATARATVVTANPRKDEDGNDMSIDITSRAANVSPSFTSSLVFR